MTPHDNRLFRITTSTRLMGFSADDPTLSQLWELGREQRQLLQAMGPFDPAYQFIAQHRIRLENLAFLRECHDRQLSPETEHAFRKLLPELGEELFKHTADSAFAKAIEYEDLSKQPAPHPSLKNAARAKSDAYLTLSGLLAT
jgi:hypothetical protein